MRLKVTGTDCKIWQAGQNTEGSVLSQQPKQLVCVKKSLGKKNDF